MSTPTVEPLAVGYQKMCEMIGAQPTNATLLTWEKAGRFPRRLCLGDRVHVWLISSIRTWLQERQESAASDLAERAVKVRKPVAAKQDRRQTPHAEAA